MEEPESPLPRLAGGADGWNSCPPGGHPAALLVRVPAQAATRGESRLRQFRFMAGVPAVSVLQREQH